MISLLGAPLVLLPVVERALRDTMLQDSAAECSSDADCVRAWADGAGKALAGVSNAGQCTVSSGRCKYSGEEAYMQVVGTGLLANVVPLLAGLLLPCTALRAAPNC